MLVIAAITAQFLVINAVVIFEPQITSTGRISTWMLIFATQTAMMTLIAACWWEHTKKSRGLPRMQYDDIRTGDGLRFALAAVIAIIDGPMSRFYNEGISNALTQQMLWGTVAGMLIALTLGGLDNLFRTMNIVLELDGNDRSQVSS